MLLKTINLYSESSILAQGYCRLRVMPFNFTLKRIETILLSLR
jgi:hypothetical protein